MTPSQRIALNTIATYFRSLLAAALALFSTRWVLTTLGASDFGLFAVVGSIITFIAFLNNVMAGSAARYLAYSIGEGDLKLVNQWFNAILGIHMILPVMLIIIGWPIGEYCLVNVLKIPYDRVHTALMVFRISLLSAFVGMATIPFNSMYIAKQTIYSLAVWGALQSILLLVLSYVLIRIPGDHLLVYTAGVVIISIVTQIGLSIQAIVVFPECKIVCSQLLDIKRFLRIISFAGWNLIGSFGAILRNQGTAILLNIYFGPKVNAAFGIANSVSTQVMSLSVAMTGAISPEMTASEGRGDREYMINMALRMCKYSTLLVMILSVPLILEVDYVMRLWLKEVPQYSDTLCRLMLVMFIIDQLSVGYSSAINAQGKISAYQITLGSILILTLPIAWFFLKLGYPPSGVGIAFVITMSLVSLGRVYWGKELLDMPPKDWIVQVVYPCVIVGIMILMPSVFMQHVQPPSIYRFSAIVLTSIASSVLSIWFLVLKPKEKSFFIEIIKRLIKAMRAKSVCW